MAVEQTLTRGRVAIIGAHPDDETASAGGILARMPDPVVVAVTDGSPHNLSDAHAAGYSNAADYARARRAELLAAMALAAVPEERVLALGFTDQETSLSMANLARRIAGILADLGPAAVLTHSYEGGHPDHDACAFAVHAACAMVAAPPRIYEFASYHAASNNGGIETGRFIGDEHGEAITLSEEQRALKQQMMDCFVSQRATLQHFPIDVERFRASPAYDFTAAPHAGKLFYEHFNWGMDGKRWRALASAAMTELGLSGAL